MFSVHFNSYAETSASALLFPLQYAMLICVSLFIIQIITDYQFGYICLSSALLDIVWTMSKFIQ